MMLHFNKSASDITYFVTYFGTHSLVWMCKLPLEQMTWNKYVEYKKRVGTEARSFWWACLCGGGGFLLNMTNDPSNRTHLQRQTKRYTSTTELQLPKCPKLSSPAKTATEPLVWYLTTSEFAVSVSVIKLMNAIDLFFWKKFPNNLHICIYHTIIPMLILISFLKFFLKKNN
jgi:hypothetical protein